MLYERVEDAIYEVMKNKLADKNDSIVITEFINHLYKLNGNTLLNEKGLTLVKEYMIKDVKRQDTILDFIFEVLDTFALNEIRIDVLIEIVSSVKKGINENNFLDEALIEQIKVDTSSIDYLTITIYLVKLFGTKFLNKEK